MDRTIEFTDLTGHNFSIFVAKTSTSDEFLLKIREIETHDCVQPLLSIKQLRILMNDLEVILNYETNLQP